jgi:hypothetical protein
MKMNYRKMALIVILLVLVIVPRLAALKSFVTIDEPFWLSVGANFYYALGQREFQNTVYEYHPAVTTMWFVTGAMLTYFPAYRGMGQGYFDVDKNNFDPFLLEHGISPLELLYYGRLFQLALIVLLALAIFHVLSQLVGDEKAFLVVGMMSSAPFFLGHSLLLNHEAILAFCVLTSIFSMMAYCEAGRKLPYLLISGTTASLAQLTKSSAIALLPVIILILVVSLFQHRNDGSFGRALLDHLKIIGLWFAVLILVYVILWPGMWVAPGKMLYEVYGNALSYAFQGSRLAVTHELQPSQFRLNPAEPSMWRFIMNLLWHATPIVWIGVILAAAAFLLRKDKSPSPKLKRLMLYLLLIATLFILMFSLARGRNSAHYILTSHISLDVVAALGWGVWLGWLSTNWKPLFGSGIRIVLVMALAALQLWSALSFYPYYYTYYNPLMSKLTGRTPGYGYGEGLELAADYLATIPNSEKLTAFAYPGRGPFSYFFPGKTLVINTLYADEPGMVSMVERLKLSDYMVFYESFLTHTERTALFATALKGVEPERVISVQGLENILIYRVADFPPEFYETISK